MKNILVTGANGQLGSELRALVCESGADAKCSYFFTDVAELDITDAEAVSKFVSANGIDVVINCAAFTNVDRAEDEEVLAEKLNNLAVGNLACACAAAGAFLVHVSTDYVFDGSASVPYVESDTPCPTGAYGRTKLAGERSAQQSGCGYMIIRTAWLYSAYGNNFVKTMRKLTSEREVVKVVFDQVGTPTFAGDLAGVIFSIVEGDKYRGNEGIYHFSNEGVCSWYDFALAIRDTFGNSSCRIEPCHSDEFPSKVHRPSFSVLDKTKIKNTFGITIPHWRDALCHLTTLLSQHL